MLLDSVIIWCWWQIGEWLWCIGRVILATGNWSTETNLSQCHSSTINPRYTDMGMNPALWTEKMVPDYLHAFLFFFFWLISWLKEGPQILPANPKADKKNKQRFDLPLCQLFSVHSLRMHMGHNALHYHSHTALRNWWYSLHQIYQKRILAL